MVKAQLLCSGLPWMEAWEKSSIVLYYWSQILRKMVMLQPRRDSNLSVKCQNIRDTFY